MTLNNFESCKNCKETIFSYVREIKDDLKEIVKEKASAVIDHLTDLVHQINISLDEGSQRMGRIEGDVKALKEKIEVKETGKRRLIIEVVLWVVGILIAQGLVITFAVQAAHKDLNRDVREQAQKLIDYKEVDTARISNILLEHARLTNRIINLETDNTELKRKLRYWQRGSNDSH